MKKIVVFLCILFFAINLQAQQVSSYSINVHFFPRDAQMWGYPVSNDAFMKGNSTIKFSKINSDKLTFYLHGELKIDSIVSDNKIIKYDSEKVLYSDDYSRVGLKTTINSSDMKPGNKLSIYYSGFMNPSKARSLSDYMRINKDSGVFLRSYGYSLWFPVFLEPDQDSYKTYFENITVRLPEKFKGVATGELINETVENGDYTAVWKPGMADIHNIQFAAREYKIVSKDNLFVYYMHDQEIAEKIIDFSQKLKNLFIANFQSIKDTSSLYIIELPKYGNISSQNIIGISADVYNNFNNSLYSKSTIAHELVHPYVYIPVSKDNSFSALVVEGFPSFFHLYGLKRTTDSKVFDLEKYMRQVEKSYLQKKQTGKDRRGNELPAELPILEISYDNIGTYKDLFILSDRVRLFFYHIWGEMGDEKFDLFVKDLFQFKTIDYLSFEKLVLKYIPTYKGNLNTWLKTTDYPESLQIKDKL